MLILTGGIKRELIEAATTGFLSHKVVYFFCSHVTDSQSIVERFASRLQAEWYWCVSKVMPTIYDLIPYIMYANCEYNCPFIHL